MDACTHTYKHTQKITQSSHNVPMMSIPSFLTPDHTLTLSNICATFKDVNDWTRDAYEEFAWKLQHPCTCQGIGFDLNTPEFWEAFFKLFLENHPAPSWLFLARAAYLCDADSVSDLILRKYIRGYHELSSISRANIIASVFLYYLLQTRKE